MSSCEWKPKLDMIYWLLELIFAYTVDIFMKEKLPGKFSDDIDASDKTGLCLIIFTFFFFFFFFYRTNPLGMKGHIAKRYGELIKDLWAGNAKSIAPLKLRVSILVKSWPQWIALFKLNSKSSLLFIFYLFFWIYYNLEGIACNDWNPNPF